MINQKIFKGEIKARSTRKKTPDWWRIEKSPQKGGRRKSRKSRKSRR
jgi:hypothetical protein